MRKVIEDKLKKSSEITFIDNLELNEEREYEIWNHNKHKNEFYIIKKENIDTISIYLAMESQASILDYYGIWNDLSEEQLNIITESISDIRKNIMKRFYPDNL